MTPPITKSASDAGLPALIPRSVLFGNPKNMSPRICASGDLLAYLAPDTNNVLQVWLRTIGKEDDHIITADKRRGIRIFFWTYQQDHLIYMQDSDGDENFHVYLVNIRTKIVRDISPFQGIRAEVREVSPDFPTTVVIQMNIRDRSLFDLYAVDIVTGETRLVFENPGTAMSFTLDDQLEVRAMLLSTPDAGFDLKIRTSASAEWKLARHWPQDEEGGPVIFSKDGKTLYIIGNHESNAKRLIALETSTGAEATIAQDPQYDVSGLTIHPLSRIIEAVAFERDRTEWTVLDESVKADFARLGEIHAGVFQVVSRDLADKTWIVEYVVDNGPSYYYVYDRSGKTASLLFTSQPDLEDQPLVHMQPVTFESRDAVTIHAYLSLPAGVEPKGLKTVLFVHGGPWARDSWRFDAGSQWLANRGYAVLQVNYRGSSGYGKNFLNLGNREWGGKMHDDLIDSVDWLIQSGISDPKRIAIMGGSYGGYATLVGMTFTPDVFAAGVDIVGVSNLTTFMKSIPPYWAPMLALLYHRVGNMETEEEFLRSRSPVYFADRIKAPLLIGQGANDPRVVQDESEQIVAAMRKNNKPVEYVLFPDEGHGFARPENRMHFFALAEEFLARYIGGRCEPVGDTEGSTAVIARYTGD